MTRALLAATVAAALAVAGCGKASPGASTGASVPTGTTLSATTPAPKRDVGAITWALYRAPGTLDPIQAFDYPEITVVTSLCESLMRQQPDGTSVPGLAKSLEHPNDRTTVIKLRRGPTFWNGKPVTAADVAFSLKRAADPKAGGFYSPVFDRVASIRATGSDEVTIALKEPDYWLDGELSQMPGIVVEKASVQAKGKAFGTPRGGIMCTGPFKVGKFTAGGALSVVRNERFWDPDRRAKVARINFKTVASDASVNSALRTGDVDGIYPQSLSTLDQLRADKGVTVSAGPSFALDAMIVSDLKGPLGDVRVRQALSSAIDRKAYVSSVYQGSAEVPRTLANPGTWGYARDVFQSDSDRLPAPRLDLAKAKALVKQAGAAGKTITLGMTNEQVTVQSAATAIRSAGESIGLKVKLDAVSSQDYINFFVDPKARSGVDGFFTVNYPDYADPAALYKTFALPGGSQNYNGFSDPKVTAALDAARSSKDPEARAKSVTEAGDRLMQLLPWIPIAAPNAVVVTNSKLTGAPASFVYMGGPWANLLGGK